MAGHFLHDPHVHLGSQGQRGRTMPEVVQPDRWQPGQTSNQDYQVRHRLSPRQAAMVLAGGQIPLIRNRNDA